jgi:hypothetical protein
MLPEFIPAPARPQNEAKARVPQASSAGYLAPTSIGDCVGSSSMIDFFSPARRISIRERDPSEFTRRSAASPVYLMPFFAQVPFAVAKNCPSFQSVTRTPACCDSQLNSYRPAGTSAPFIVTVVCKRNGRAFFAQAGKPPNNKTATASTANLNFILPLSDCWTCVVSDVFASTSLLYRQIYSRLKLVRSQIGMPANLECLPIWRACLPNRQASKWAYCTEKFPKNFRNSLSGNGVQIVISGLKDCREFAEDGKLATATLYCR